MKEVRQISLSGVVFFVEEDAYRALEKYMTALDQYYADKEDGKEIIEDIQIRFAELLSEKRSYQGQAITLSHVEEVISILGYPENFEQESEEETATPKRKKSQSHKKYRRLYRDGENALLGGVCSGLSYYFGIDALIFRLIFICLGIFSFGFWGLVYVILWAIVPLAKTTLQQYEMKGKALNIEDIEQRIKEEVNDAGERIKSFVNNNADTIKNTGYGIYAAGKNILGFICKILGFCLISVSVFVAFMVVLAWFFPISSFFKTSDTYGNFCPHELFPLFGLNSVTSCLCFVWILLPAVLFFLLGMIFLARKIRRTITFMLPAAFILWIILCVILGAGTIIFYKDRKMNAFCETATINVPVSAETIVVKPDPPIVFGETLRLRFAQCGLLIRSENSKNQIYGIPDIDSHIVYTNDSNVVVRVLAENFKTEQERVFQENIRIEDAIIYIPSVFPLEGNYWSGEKITVQLLIPTGKQVIIDKSFTNTRYRYRIDLY
jgi:phage shock protein PspC (stress-responsive transcriptional regulator)